MPQMLPINWILIYNYVILIVYMFMIYNFFSNYNFMYKLYDNNYKNNLFFLKMKW